MLYSTLKGGYANFDMCIFTLNWSILTPNIFCTIFPQGCFLFSLLGQTISVWHWGWGCYENTKENENWYTGNWYIFCCNCQRTLNLKLKLWGYNEKNMGFHLTPKKYFRLSPGDVIAMRTYRTTLKCTNFITAVKVKIRISSMFNYVVAQLNEAWHHDVIKTQ